MAFPCTDSVRDSSGKCIAGRKSCPPVEMDADPAEGRDRFRDGSACHGAQVWVSMTREKGWHREEPCPRAQDDSFLRDQEQGVVPGCNHHLNGIDPVTSPCWSVRIIVAAFVREDAAHDGHGLCPWGIVAPGPARWDGVSSGVLPPVSPVHEECPPAVMEKRGSRTVAPRSTVDHPLTLHHKEGPFHARRTRGPGTMYRPAPINQVPSTSVTQLTLSSVVLVKGFVV